MQMSPDLEPKDIVLIPGAWHGAWCWERVANRLLAAGQRVHALTLTGLAERANLLTERTDLETHLADVIGYLQSNRLRNVVLVGHSYGGMVISGVADRVPGLIAKRVYVDAFVPEDGESLAAYIAPSAAGKPFMPPLPMEYFRLNEADRAWASAKCTPHPAASWLQKIRLDGKAAAIPSVYIRATGWAKTFDRDERRAVQRGWEIIHVDCGHEVMLDRPEFLAGTLLQIARGC